MENLNRQDIDTAPIRTVRQWTDDFEAWTDEQARKYNELEADRFACGGSRCTGSHNSL